MNASAPHRRARLAAMGVVCWRQRPGAGCDAAQAARDPDVRAVTRDADVRAVTRDPDVHALVPDADVPALARDSDRRAVTRDDRSRAPARDATQSAQVLAALREQVAACTRCALHGSRTQTVFGTGDAHARLLVVGEAPGADEDAQGEPFVGRAGRLLDAMLRAIGLQRAEVYIANILKCRPPGNRDPRPEEVASCAGYLQQQIDTVAPELILAVGRIAAQNLLGVTTPIARLRGREHRHPASATPVLVTYHPAYLLRSPLEKRRAWEDLAQVAARLGLEP